MNTNNKPSIPQDKVLLDNLGKIAYTLDKAYISNLTKEYMPIPYSDGDYAYCKNVSVDYASNIRALKVNRWVFNKDEKPGECFKNVLSLFADGEHTLAMVVIRKPTRSEVYFVVKNDGEGRNEDSKTNISLLRDSIIGNFPGTGIKLLETPDEIKSTEELFSFPFAESISVLTNNPSEFSEDYITQGIDKLLNGITPYNEEETYAVVFLAESLAYSNIREIIDGYEDMATAIHPFANYQFQIGENETSTHGEMESTTDTYSISNSVSKTHSVNLGANLGVHGGVSAGLGLGKLLNIGATIGASLGISGGYGYSWGETKTISNSTSHTKGKSSSLSLGKNESTSYSYKSYMVSNLIEKLSETIERLENSKATGLWKYATYILTSNSKQSKNIANFIRATSQGKESHIEPATIQEWSKKEKHDENGGNEFDEIIQYISHFTHPVFVTADTNNQNAMAVTPTSYVSTDEVSQMIAFPRNSVAGLPVIQCACFGREPNSISELSFDMKIGNAYHMYSEDKNKAIKISKNNLTSHTFITGSTGSGKSNTIYFLLNELCAKNSNDTHFLVIEPAKGEYKHIFGNRKDVSVYGTNPDISSLLRLNPFSFPKGIHILEHLDRLVEIFNVCWPMYAAMPAVLKNAIEKSYEDCGWNLIESENSYGDNLYPQFSDVARNVKAIIDSSEYDAENKGAYKGSLLTRLKSLTNGINGLIFTTDELSMEALFDENVIVDLSRVGSSETKSLIMGMLVLKLQEYRMTQGEMNAPLKHITVLEEAHNLLKRTSTEQVSESANLLGKSVEMISNAIAEMRTYGEGFIIADQSPALLDMAAIRNTNTKIIMRLPDITDRELVGKAANLDGNQIAELAKLPCGVAAVYQNEWIQPVLCKVEKYNTDGRIYKYNRSNDKTNCKPNDMVKIIQNLSNGTRLSHNAIVTYILPKLQKNRVNASVQVAIAKQLENPPKKPRMTKLAPIVCALFPELLTAMKEIYAETHSVSEWTAYIENHLREIVQQEINNQTRCDIIQGVVTHYLLNEINDVPSHKKWKEKGGLK